MPKTEAYNDLAPLINLYLLADIAMAHTQLSDSNSFKTMTYCSGV